MYSVEYNLLQRCLHIDDLDNTLQLNRKNIRQNINNDWQIIGIFDDIEKADCFADNFLERLNKNE